MEVPPMNDYLDDPARLRRWRAEGLTVARIAALCGCHVATVHKRLKAFGLRRRADRPGLRKRPRRASRRVRLPARYGETVVERARRRFGERLPERPLLGYFLGGRPASSLRLRALLEAEGADARRSLP